MSHLNDLLVRHHDKTSNEANLLDALKEACAEVDRLRLALAASRDEAEKAKAELERVVKDRDLGDDELSILYESVASIANGFNVQPPGKICRDSIIAADELRLQRKELTNPFKESDAARADAARKEQT
jgi:hypothetical protein